MEMLWSIFYVIFLGIVSHFFGQALPRDRFHEDRFPYKSYGWEKDGSIYRRIGIQKWRDKLPDMSRYLSDMVPKKLTDGMSAADVRVLVKETCVAEYVHVMLCVAFLFVCRFWSDHTWILLWLIYTACNIPFMLIQRYNRPLLLRVLVRLEAREIKAAAHGASAKALQANAAQDGDKLAVGKNGGGL